MKRTMVMSTFVLAVAAFAAVPPRVNYQGVLRNAAGNPLNGTYDMVFRFYDSPMAGMLLYTDQHLAAGSGGMTVTGGLFNVALGSGVPGSGIEMSFPWVFQNWETVHVEVQVGSETLSPRVPILSAGFAVNADYLDGMDSYEFARVESPNTFITTQTVLSGAASARGVVVRGTPAQSANLQEWQDASGTPLASVGPGGTFSGSGAGLTSVDAASLGGLDGSQLLNTSAAGQTKAGYLSLSSGLGAVGPDYGISSYGSQGGGAFRDLELTSEAYVASGDRGIFARGAVAGAYFEDLDLDDTGDAYLGTGDIGILARGDGSGGYFANQTSPVTGSAAVGSPGVGIDARGTNHAGHMAALGASGEAWLGRGHVGIEATGQSFGGVFTGESAGVSAADPSDGGLAYLGSGTFGVRAYGPSGGGFLANHEATSSQTGAAQVGFPGHGIAAYGTNFGGFFQDMSSTNWGYAYVGLGDRGIESHGTYGTTDTGEGGRFCDRLYTGRASLADGNTGVIGYGSYAGGIFLHGTSMAVDCAGTAFDNEVRLATATSAIESAAPKNFVQNHPYDPNRLIVYTSLEGDEVGTYTRGTAALTEGVARVPLGATFAWVTNPDIGLTAHVTPRGTWSDLYVESLTASEIVVRSRDDKDGQFDYVVHGLRIGFEEASVVRERNVDAPVPSMAPHEELYAARPDLRELNALERFRRMREATGETGALDLERSRELLAAIGVHDPALHGASKPELLGGPVASVDVALPPEAVGPEAISRETRPPVLGEGVLLGQPAERDDGPKLPAYSFPVPVAEAVEAGDVLANDPLLPGTLRPAMDPASPGVVGIVAGDVGAIWRGEAPLALAGTVVACKADASYGAIRTNDLLVASPTPGHAMRSPADVPGTILGKALEPLDAGTGSIRVLVMPR